MRTLPHQVHFEFILQFAICNLHFAICNCPDPLSIEADRMPEYAYTALAKTGTRSQGTLTAVSEREAMAMLDARGLFPVNIQVAKAKARSFQFGTNRRIRSK